MVLCRDITPCDVIWKNKLLEYSEKRKLIFEQVVERCVQNANSEEKAVTGEK